MYKKYITRPTQLLLERIPSAMRAFKVQDLEQVTQEECISFLNDILNFEVYVFKAESAGKDINQMWRDNFTIWRYQIFENGHLSVSSCNTSSHMTRQQLTELAIQQALEIYILENEL